MFSSFLTNLITGINLICLPHLCRWNMVLQIDNLTCNIFKHSCIENMWNYWLSAGTVLLLMSVHICCSMQMHVHATTPLSLFFMRSAILIWISLCLYNCFESSDLGNIDLAGRGSHLNVMLFSKHLYGIKRNTNQLEV